VQRQEAQAHAGDHGLLDGLVAAHFHDDARLQVRLLQELLQRGTGARTLLADDEFKGTQCLG